MVLKAARLGLATAEVPVKFYKDREGRVSHHRRMGWLSPWIAGWLNLKVMLVYTPDSFLLKPGLALMAIGLLLSLGLAGGPLLIGNIGFSLYWMLFGVTCTTLGYSSVQIGSACTRHARAATADLSRRVQKLVTYDRGMLGGGRFGRTGVDASWALWSTAI